MAADLCGTSVWLPAKQKGSSNYSSTILLHDDNSIMTLVNFNARFVSVMVSYNLPDNSSRHHYRGLRKQRLQAGDPAARSIWPSHISTKPRQLKIMKFRARVICSRAKVLVAEMLWRYTWAYAYI